MCLSQPRYSIPPCGTGSQWILRLSERMTCMFNIVNIRLRTVIYVLISTTVLNSALWNWESVDTETKLLLNRGDDMVPPTHIHSTRGKH